MRNYIQPGEVIDHTASANIAAGDLVVLEDRVGVASVDIANGDTGSVAVDGVFEVPAGTLTAAVKQGQVLYAAGNGKVDDTSTSNAVAGYAFVAAAKSDDTILVKING